MELSRGSEWRKWDLHIHTPASVLNNQFGDWDSYIQELFKAAIRENVQAIGITDYYIPEGYRKIKTEYLLNEGKLKELFSDSEIDLIRKIYLFPNIEFRISKLLTSDKENKDWGNKFNYHLLLCGDLDIDDIESEVISQLSIEYDATVGVATEKRPLTKRTIEEFGQRLKAEHSGFIGSDFFIGACNASINESDLAQILKGNSRYNNKYMLGIPSDEDLSKISWNSQSHSIRKNLIKQSHFIFSSNPKTVSFMLGEYNKDQHVSEFGEIKPCLWGSDAHSLVELFKPKLNRYTWIKADLNFSGLKQVVYDPESRVKIQENNPHQKNDYQIIKRARFINKSSKEVFTDEWINFNADLNTIIGGKSSGKSLLLYNLAKANNKDEVTEKMALAKMTPYTQSQAYDFEVEWNNGEVCKLSDENTKPITYIPQLYINQLAEREGKNDLNELISKVLSQRENFKTETESIRSVISDNNINISTKLSELFSCINHYNYLRKECLGVGVKGDVEKQIRELNNQSEELRKKSGFSEQEQKIYNLLMSRNKSLLSRKEFLIGIDETTKKVILSYKVNSEVLFSSLLSSIKRDVAHDVNSKLMNYYFEFINSSLQFVYPSIESNLHEKIKKIPYWLNKIESDISKVNTSLLPFTAKIKEQSKLKEISEKLIVENGKLKRINEKQAEIDKQTQMGTDIKSSLQNSYLSVIEGYSSIVSLVNDPINSFGDEISVQAEVTYDNEQFNAFLDLFDRRANLTEFMAGLLDAKGNVLYDHEEHAQKINLIYDKIRLGKGLPNLKNGVTAKDLLNKLYSDCFRIDYSVFYKNDEILQMSPGKRGLVLMSILLHLSNSEHPILIDQPEDNLDNRTIYDQLKGYIRSKKLDRQIIMVTHNANLVVSTDAECIIVANQSGQQAGNENEKYQFEYCFGSLENNKIDGSRKGILFESTIRDHVCHILEGGVKAFKEREIKYGMKH
ncbi:TrlF family AAA-like ATPase [Pantoea agglomerans]|uniref:TrlF family AAA-like ATPase n=1 Tax=Enterobacter agglomerans TaxID=549 RepID=UPI00315B28C3